MENISILAGGYGQIYGRSSSYATARSTAYAYSATGAGIGQVDDEYSDIFIRRLFLKFDTSVLQGALIDSVKLQMTVLTDSSVTDFDIQISKADWSGLDPLSDANKEAAYDLCLAATPDLSYWLNSSEIVVGTPQQSGELDKDYINLSGFTYYGLLSQKDYAGIAPATTSPTGNEYINIYRLGYGDESLQPRLLIGYHYPALGIYNYT